MDDFDFLGLFGGSADNAVQGDSINALDNLTMSDPSSPTSVFSVSPDARGDTLSTAAAIPTTNGNYIPSSTNGGGGASASSLPSFLGGLGSSLKSGADSLLGVYKDYTGLQIAGQQLSLAQQNAKLSSQVTGTQMNAAAQIAQSQAAKDVAVANAQAQQAINAAQIAARNSLGVSSLTLPSQKLATYATLIGLGVAVYAAFKQKG